MSKRRLMKCDSAVSEVIGTVLLVGLVSVCFSILYVEIMPQIQGFSDSLRLYPSVTCLNDNGTLEFLMESGLPVTAWSINIDGLEVSSGSEFAVGIPVFFTPTHHSIHDVSLIENCQNGYSRLIYFGRLNIGNNSTPPEEEPPEHYTGYLTNWSLLYGAGSMEIDGYNVSFSSTQDCMWVCPLNQTGDFEVIGNITEHGDSYHYFSFGIGSGYSWVDHCSEMKSIGDGYSCWSHGATECPLYNPFLLDETLRWSQKIYQNNQTVDYSLKQGSTVLGAQTDLVWLSLTAYPDFVFCYCNNAGCNVTAQIRVI